LQGELEQLQLHATAPQRSKREQEIKKQVEEVQGQVTAREQELERDMVRFALMSLENQVAQLEVKLEAGKAMEQDFVAQEAELLKESNQFGRSPWEMENLQKDIRVLEDVIGATAKQYEQLKDELVRPARVMRNTRVKSDTIDAKIPDEKLTLQELAEAIQPRSPDQNSQLTKTAAAALAAFGLVVGGILYLEVRTKRVTRRSMFRRHSAYK